MPEKTKPGSPGEMPRPDQSPEIKPDYKPETPIIPDADPAIAPQPETPWPDRTPPSPDPEPGTPHAIA